MKYPLTCQQIGQFGSDVVTPPVFAVRKGDNGQIDLIRSNTSEYNFSSGKLNRTGFLPHQTFYLIVDGITMEDDDSQFVCINEDDVGYVDEYFAEKLHTTIVVPSDEGKEIINPVNISLSINQLVRNFMCAPSRKMFKGGGVWGFQHRISKSIYSMFPNIDRFVSYTIL